MFGDGFEEAGLAEFLGEGVGWLGRRFFEHPETSSVVSEQHFAVATVGEAGDLECGISEFLVEDSLVAFTANSPDASGGIVAIEEDAIEFREQGSAADNAAGEAACFGVGVFGGGIHDGLWAAGALGVEGVAAFLNAPAIVFSAADFIDLFPEVLSVLSDPDFAGLLVDIESPGVAKAIGPDFGASPGSVDEGVIGGDGIVLTI